jgi:ornithine cyclodeaminase
MNVRLIRDAEAVALLDLDRAYDAIRDAYVQAATMGPVLSAPSAQLMRHPSAPDVAMKVKGAQLPRQRVSGFRFVGDFESDLGEISHDFQLLTHMDTAEPFAMVEMLTLHGVRTAITGVVALEAYRGARCSVITVVGAGRIAEHLVRVLRHRLNPAEIRIVASRPERAEAFAARHGADVVAYGSIDAAMDGADAAIAITSAKSPILFGRHLQPGMTLIGMGGSHECDISMLSAADQFFVDDLDYACVSGSLGAWVRRGEISKADAATRVSAELGQVAAGQIAVRRTATDRLFAIVQGMACCDLALAADIASRS